MNSKPSEPIKVLLLEGLNETGQNILRNAGYIVESHAKALDVEVLKEKIKDADIIGIRSKTKLNSDVLKCATKLKVIGCFCIGTNQVDLEYAASKGIAVFNSPFSNSRSVAEMVIALIICLSRQLGDRNTELHNGIWNKTSINSHEIRGKSLGIVGYGHIGSQLSVLAEAFGMVVYYFDIAQKLPLGRATFVPTLKELFSSCDVISLHVPETNESKNMIGKEQLSWLKKGAIFINASRGTVVDIPALASVLKSGHLNGAAVDVYPVEPFKNGSGFETELQGCPNTILSPHIGGSTEEAQAAIGVEVGNALVKFLQTGATIGCVNFPESDIRQPPKENLAIRITNVHLNVPGVLKQISKALSPFNVEKQICISKNSIGYLMADIKLDRTENAFEIYDALNKMKENIRTNLIYG